MIGNRQKHEVIKPSWNVQLVEFGVVGRRKKARFLCDGLNLWSVLLGAAVEKIVSHCLLVTLDVSCMLWELQTSSQIFIDFDVCGKVLTRHDFCTLDSTDCSLDVSAEGNWTPSLPVDISHFIQGAPTILIFWERVPSLLPWWELWLGFLSKILCVWQIVGVWGLLLCQVRISTYKTDLKKCFRVEGFILYMQCVYNMLTRHHSVTWGFNVTWLDHF